MGNGDENKQSPRLLHLDSANDTWGSHGGGGVDDRRPVTRAVVRQLPVDPTDVKDDLKVKAGVTLVDILWGKKGELLPVDRARRRRQLHHGIRTSGNVKLTTALNYQVIKQVKTVSASPSTARGTRSTASTARRSSATCRCS